MHRPALQFDDDAQALEHHVHHLPRASLLLAAQLRPRTVPMERAVTLPREDKVALRGTGAGRRPVNRCVVVQWRFFHALVHPLGRLSDLP